MKKLIVLLFTVWLVQMNLCFADEREDTSLSQRLSALEKQVGEIKGGVIGKTGFEINGFVDTSFFYDDNASASTFSLDEVEIDISREFSTGFSIRADLNFRNMDDDDGSLNTDEILEQGYVTFTFPFNESLSFTFGKFNAPIGFELLDPPDMYQFSHALVFNLGIPTNVTGVMTTFSPSDFINVNLYFVNGWDQISDNNKDKTVGARVGFTPSENFGLGLSAIFGPERTGEDGDKRFVLDLDASINLPGQTLIGLEVNYGEEEKLPGSLPLPGQDVEWFGLLIMAHRDFNDWMGITLRYDYFDDNDGARTGTVQQLQAATVAFTFSLGEGLGALVEYRHDWSDIKSFVLAGGGFDDNNDTIAVEFTYSF